MRSGENQANLWTGPFCGASPRLFDYTVAEVFNGCRPLYKQAGVGSIPLEGRSQTISLNLTQCVPSRQTTLQGAVTSLPYILVMNTPTALLCTGNIVNRITSCSSLDHLGREHSPAHQNNQVHGGVAIDSTEQPTYLIDSHSSGKEPGRRQNEIRYVIESRQLEELEEILALRQSNKLKIEDAEGKVDSRTVSTVDSVDFIKPSNDLTPVSSSVDNSKTSISQSLRVHQESISSSSSRPMDLSSTIDSATLTRLHDDDMEETSSAQSSEFEGDMEAGGAPSESAGSTKALRRAERRARNRDAARRCRQKRRSAMKQLSEDFEMERKKNSELKTSLRTLQKQVAEFRLLLISHMQTTNVK